MGRRILFLVSLFLSGVISLATAGFENRPSAQGVAGSVPGTDGIGNPAVWSGIHGILSTFRFYQPWGFQELQVLRAGAGFQIGPGVWVMDVSHFGGDLYREFTGSAAFAMHVFDEIDAGITGNYHHLSIEGAGSASAFTIDAGVRLQLVDGVRFGVAADNIFQTEIGHCQDPLPSRLKTGIWIAFSEWIEGGADWIREADFDQDFQLLFRLNLTEDVHFSTGWLQGSREYSAGGSVKTSLVTIQYQTYIHSDLGLTHDVGLSFSFGNEEPPVNQVVLYPSIEKESGSRQTKRVISLVEINHANEMEWDQLPGVSSSLARSIVSWRLKRGGFQSVEELIGVPGMTPELLEKIKPYLRLLVQPADPVAS